VRHRWRRRVLRDDEGHRDHDHDDQCSAAARDRAVGPGRRCLAAGHDAAGRDDRVVIANGKRFARATARGRSGDRRRSRLGDRPRLAAARAQGQGHCSTFLPSKAKFAGIRCGASNGVWFKVGSSANWSYLLPAVLPSGSYTLDVRVTDRAHNYTTALDGGRSVSFTVG
jgi:hypothetical protein